MKSKSKDLKKNVAAKEVSLKRLLNKNKIIQNDVVHASNDLNSINKVLNQGKKVTVPVKTLEKAMTLNVEVEHKVEKAADDLQQVNVDLAIEVDERAAVESELVDTKTDLAKVRDDLSKSQDKEEEIREIMFQDALTGLPNRTLFEQHLDQGLILAKRQGWGLAVLFLDIDEFKRINDTHGHDLGDKVLLMVANRLQSLIRDEDTVSRWGGDEFMCLLLEVKEAADVTRLAEKMVNRIARACNFNGAALSIKASIGIAIYPANGETADTLFKNADTAMFKAKGTKKRVVLSCD